MGLISYGFDELRRRFKDERNRRGLFQREVFDDPKETRNRVCSFELGHYPRRGRIKIYEDKLREWESESGIRQTIATSEVGFARESARPYGEPTNHDLDKTKIGFIVGRLRQLILEIEDSGVESQDQAYEIVSVFNGIVDRFIFAKDQCAETAMGNDGALL